MTLTITTTHLTWMTPSLQSQDCVGFIISPPSATSARAFSSRMQNHRSKKHQKTKKTTWQIWQDPSLCIPPWGLQPCSSCFVGFLVLFFGIGWDARGETLCNKQSFCTQASYLSRLQYCHQKVALSQRNAAVFIYKMHDLSQSVVFFSKGTNYFFKKSSISWRDAVFCQYMQYSLKRAVILKMFCRPFSVQYCHKRYSSFQRTAYIVWLAMFHVQNTLASHSVAFLLKQQH